MAYLGKVKGITVNVDFTQDSTLKNIFKGSSTSLSGYHTVVATLNSVSTSVKIDGYNVNFSGIDIYSALSSVLPPGVVPISMDSDDAFRFKVYNNNNVPVELYLKNEDGDGLFRYVGNINASTYIVVDLIEQLPEVTFDYRDTLKLYFVSNTPEYIASTYTSYTIPSGGIEVVLRVAEYNNPLNLNPTVPLSSIVYRINGGNWITHSMTSSSKSELSIGKLSWGTVVDWYYTIRQTYYTPYSDSSHYRRDTLNSVYSPYQQAEVLMDQVYVPQTIPVICTNCHRTNYPQTTKTFYLTTYSRGTSSKAITDTIDAPLMLTTDSGFANGIILPNFPSDKLNKRGISSTTTSVEYVLSPKENAPAVIQVRAEAELIDLIEPYVYITYTKVPSYGYTTIGNFSFRMGSNPDCYVTCTIDKGNCDVFDGELLEHGEDRTETLNYYLYSTYKIDVYCHMVSTDATYRDTTFKGEVDITSLSNTGGVTVYLNKVDDE